MKPTGVSFFLLLSLFGCDRIRAFTAPSLSIGSMLFPVQNTHIEPSAEASNRKLALYDASAFFVDAFWTGKVGGGTNQLTDRQRRTLEQSQTAEFTRRYGGRRSAELLICRNGNGEVIACAGVEVDRIPEGGLKGTSILAQAPLMSNLAVSRQYRRRGLAEKLVKAIETFVQDEWGYDECYLYVERRNLGALNLYRKCGYKIIWTDGDARTLLPTKQGDLETRQTALVCMRKDLNPSLFGRLFG